MPRLFLALWPSDAIVAKLRSLPRADGVRWTPPENWHVTLRFLGEADPAAVDQRLAGITLPAATAAYGPRVRAVGRGVVVVPVAGVDGLAGVVRDATAGIGQPGGGPFRGHLTLGRLRPGGRVAGEPVSGDQPVDEVTLVRSTLTPQGARYAVIARWATVPTVSGRE